MSDLAVVVVTYQSAQDVATSLGSVLATCGDLSVELVVVDNGSTDGTVDEVRRVAPAARVLVGHGNVGFGAACHLGAASTRAPYVLFLNPDTEVQPGALQALLAAATSHPGAGLWGGRTLRPDGGVEHTCAMGAITPWSLTCFALGLSSAFPYSRWLDPESLGPWQRDTAREVPVLSGACMMVARGVWDRLGGFDRRYFMYAEDADLCARAWRAGLAPRLVPDAEVVHAVGASSSQGRKQVLLHRGKATYVRRNWRPGTRWYGLLCLWLGVALRGALFPRVRRPGAVRRRSTADSWTFAWSERRVWLPGW